MARLRPRRRGLWLIGGLAALAILAVGGTWIYIHVIEGPAPAPLSLKSAATSSAAATPAASTPPAGSSASASAGTASAEAVAGIWRVASGSIVGYRVNEVLAGQQNVAVGRTSSISGSMTVSGTTVMAASVTVQMATIHSDQSQRDAQFNGRIMDTAAYPTGTLTLTSPPRWAVRAARLGGPGSRGNSHNPNWRPRGRLRRYGPRSVSSFPTCGRGALIQR